MNASGYKNPRLADVARVAGVSRATAARALGGYGSVRPDLAAMVEAAAETLGYRGNALARSVSSGRSNTIGVVISDIENPHFARAVRGITDTAQLSGFDVILANTDEKLAAERAAVDVFLAKRVDGLIVASTSRSDSAHLLEVVKMKRPLVLFDEKPDNIQADWVGTNSYADAKQVVKYLTARGHRKIAFISATTKTPTELEAGFPLPVSTIADRVRAIREESADESISYEFLTTAMSSQRTHDVVSELVSRRDRPTALIASYSKLALPAFQAIRELGLSIPRDISLICLDDADWMGVSAPEVSAIAVPAYDLGAKAASVLIDRIRGTSTDVTDHLLPSRFIERASVADLSRPKLTDHV
ncbi:LacI family DNA-binding transcriptional regulator [Pseudarthrobacter sp. AG30]|uniref:LacI family DNA-binding transcriptional regulator n=1 Tax=Pseudarthrobacter sp. AG30 TaxID=2249742 RepID=UPI000D6EAF19|nr:LacI family DNA-binding transcriptional regulator [Pseudarthrobacter sp. AG30]RAX14932.1 LacI family DNA-binding transcriptional regulator [Pseudarthrobacter sp. AG30]